MLYRERTVTEEELVKISTEIAALLGKISSDYFCPAITHTKEVIKKNFNIVVKE